MKALIALPLLVLLLSCRPTPQPIQYGMDGCHSCKMNIVDPRYAAQVVTSKGKVYKFDAVECMVDFSLKNQETAFAYQLVNCFDQPKELAAAETCFFLISEKLPSPMGANLTAFSTQEEALQMQKEKDGKTYSWNELLDFYPKAEGKLSY